MKKVSLLLILIALPSSMADNLTFLMLWPGARSTALGGVYAPISDDPTSFYCNPAGLSFLREHHLSFTHCHLVPEDLPGAFHEFVSFTVPLSRNLTLGLHSLLFLRGETMILDTDELLGFDNASGATVGLKLREELGSGITVKYVYSANFEETMTEVKGRSLAFDIGLLSKVLPVVTVGMSLCNLGPNVEYDNGEQRSLGKMARAGLKLETSEENGPGILLTSEIGKVIDEGKLSLSLGGEFRWSRLVFLRLGYFNDGIGVRKGFTYGGAVHGGRISLDFGTDEALFNEPERGYAKFTIAYRI